MENALSWPAQPPVPGLACCKCLINVSCLPPSFSSGMDSQDIVTLEVIKWSQKNIKTAHLFFLLLKSHEESVKLSPEKKEFWLTIQ